MTSGALLIDGAPPRSTRSRSVARAVARAVARVLGCASVGCALACAGCELSAASRFGTACDRDADCTRAFVCDVKRAVCIPAGPPPPPPTTGRACDEPAPLDAPRDGSMIDIARTFTWQASNTGDGASACDAGRVFTAELVVPESVGAGAVLTISVAAPFPASVAFADTACESAASVASVASTCSDRAATGAASLVLPLVSPGTYRVLVVADADARGDFTVRVQQHECPPGFLPDGDGCLGFARVRNSTPRVGHSLDVLPDGRVVAVGGTDDEGRALSSVDVFSAATGAYTRSSLPGKSARVRAATAFLPDGRLLLAGGVPDTATDDAADTLVFVAEAGAFAELPTGPVSDYVKKRHCRMAGLSVTQPPLGLLVCEEGSVSSLDVITAPSASGCDSDIQCDEAQTCVTPVEEQPGPWAGVCVCFDGGRCGDDSEALGWLQRLRPAGLGVTGSYVLRVDGGAASAVVLIAGGTTTNQTPATPLLFFAHENDWFQAAPALTESLVRRSEPLALFQAGRVLAIGGRLIGASDEGEGEDGDPTAVIEQFDPLGRDPPVTARLARARAEAAIAPLDARRVIVLGGRDTDGALLTSTEIVDSDTLVATFGPVLPAATADARAVSLPNGDVLLLGGRTPDALAGAYLLTHRPPSLVASELGPALVPGASCADPMILSGSGTWTGNTVGHVDVEHHDRDDATCEFGNFETAGLDAFARFFVPAGTALSLAVTTPHNVDLALDVLATCPSEVCVASADDTGSGESEALTVEPVDVDRDLFVVVDSYAVGIQYEFTLDYAVTP